MNISFLPTRGLSVALSLLSPLSQISYDSPHFFPLQVHYSITVTNIGPSAAQGVSLSATLADSVSYQSVTTSIGSCSGGVFCNLGTLANGATATIQVAGTVLNPVSVESTATVASIS